MPFTQGLFKRKENKNGRHRREPSDEAKAALQEARRLWDSGCLDEAVVSYNEALRGFSEALGRDNEASQSILEDLAFLYRSKSDSSLAEDAFRQRYKARERLFGIAHRSTLEAAIDLGRAMIVLHKFDDAKTVLRTTLEAFEYQDGLDCQEKFEALSCLGDILKEQNNAEDACALYYRALAGFERTVGSESNLTVKTKYSLAAALVHTSHYVKAVETLKDVVEKTEGTFGIGHQDWMRATGSLGHTYIKMGKMKEAEVTLNRCLEQSLNSPLRSESVVKDAALDLKAVYSSLGDTSAVCIMEAWIKGGNVELPLSQKSPTNVAVHKTPDNPETLSIPAVVSDANGDTEFNRVMRIETTHGSSDKAIALLDTQCQRGNWISMRLVEKLGLRASIMRDKTAPNLTSGTGQDVKSVGAIKIEWYWHPNGTRMYHANFFVFEEGFHLDVVIGVEFIVLEDLIRVNKSAFVPLTEHRKATDSTKAAIAIEEEKQRQAKKDLEARRAAQQASQQVSQQSGGSQ